MIGLPMDRDRSRELLLFWCSQECPFDDDVLGFDTFEVRLLNLTMLTVLKLCNFYFFGGRLFWSWSVRYSMGEEEEGRDVCCGGFGCSLWDVLFEDFLSFS